MRILFSILFFFTFNLSMFSQDYKPLLDNYNEWNVRYCYNGCSSDIYYTNGDTIVNGRNFKILDGYHYISRGFLLREDVAQRKVYLKAFLPPPLGEKDYLLYDFSLKVGDSIEMKNPITPFPENGGFFKLDSIIPRPLVDQNNYRHFYFSPTDSNTISTNNATWVEGVGSLSIITAPGGDPSVDSVGRVGCMFKNGTSFYSDLEIIDECTPTFILNSLEFENTINPVQIITKEAINKFEVINAQQFKTINIFNLQGVKVGSQIVNNKESLELDLSLYQSAIYLLIFESNIYKSQTLKIIVR